MKSSRPFKKAKIIYLVYGLVTTSILISITGVVTQGFRELPFVEALKYFGAFLLGGLILYVFYLPLPHHFTTYITNDGVYRRIFHPYDIPWSNIQTIRHRQPCLFISDGYQTLVINYTLYNALDQAILGYIEQHLPRPLETYLVN